jgi:hypothetical protein
VAFVRGARFVGVAGLVAASMLMGCGDGGVNVADQVVCQKAQSFIDAQGGADPAATLIDVGNGAGDRLGDAAQTFGRFASGGYSSLDLSPLFFGDTAKPRLAVGRTLSEGPFPIAVPSAVSSATETLRATCHLRR